MKKFLLYSLGVLLLMGFLFLDNSQAHRYTPYQGNTGIDVQNYKIEFLNIDRDTKVIDFKTTISAKANRNFNSGERFGLDFVDTYTISEILFNEQTISSGNYRITYTGSISLSGTNKRLEINLPSNVNTSGDIVVVVNYSGMPKLDIDNSGLGFYSTGIELHTFNEPLGAHQRFPCNDVPGDKATLDFYVTTLTGKVVVGNGKLMYDTNNGDGTHTVYRKENYPISTYNVYIGIGPFTTVYSGTSPFLSGSQNIWGYAKSANTVLSNRVKELSTTTGMMKQMIDILGPYPFPDEKFGMIIRPINNYMEHNTIIGMSSVSNDTLMRHELAHQRLGNLITIAARPDLWINEAGGTYFPQVSRIGRSNREQASYGLSRSMDRTRALNNPSDTNLFNLKLVYNRAARVYHHLRSYLGNDLYFSGLDYYINKHAHGTVSTQQFKETREEATNINLSGFFNRFVYGIGDPVLRVTNFYDNINNGTYSGRAFFKLSRADGKARTPDVVFARINYTDGSSGEIRVFQENQNSYIEVHTYKNISGIFIDPGSGTVNRQTDYIGRLYNSGFSIQNDSDSDLLPDGREYIMFGNLNETANGDYDSDGILNIDEYDLNIESIDSTGPSFDFFDNEGYECSEGYLTISEAYDNGVGLHILPYSFDGINRGTSDTYTIPYQRNVGDITITGYVRDGSGNISTKIASYTFWNELVNSDNFTGSDSVGTGPMSVNRKTSSNANEGICGTGDISGYISEYSIYQQGEKGICNLSGDILTYTPNANQTGRDMCIVFVMDNEGEDFGNWLEVYRGGIDTMTHQSSSYPKLTVATINSGNTATLGASQEYFYNGIINISSNISDTIGINSGTCEYSLDGTNRLVANYTGTSIEGNCYKDNLDPQSDIEIFFRVKNINGITGESTSRIYIYDNQGPSFEFNNNSGYECVAGTLSINSLSDLLVGFGSNAYSFDGLSWNSSNVLNIDGQQPGTVVKTGYAKDSLGNQTIQTAVYTFNNVGISANNFTGSNNVGNSIKTGNRKILSNASEFGCGSGNVVNSGISTQASKGTCSVSGDIITYTPSLNRTGNDSCIIRMKDNENTEGFTTVYRGGIDTLAPNAVACNNSQNFDTSIDVSCTSSEGTIKYTSDGSTPTCNSNTRSNQTYNQTTTIKIIACDSYNNASSINTYIYTFNASQGSTGSMSWTGDTPTMGEIITTTGVNISLVINDSNLEKFNRNINGENFDVYNENLVFMSNANNISQIGENNTTLTDISNYGNHGTLSGAVWTGGGREGNALFFRGGNTNDRVTIMDNNSLDMTTGLTISARVKPTAFVADGVIIGKPHSTDTAPYIDYGLGYSSNARRAFQIGIGGGTTQKQCDAATGTANVTGVYSHVVGVFNYNTLKIYINGNLSNTCTFTGLTLNNLETPLYLGYYPYFNGTYNFKGKVDDIMLYNKALEIDQIQVLYKMHLNKYSLEDWTFSIDYNGLNPGVYTYTGLAQSIGGYQYRLNRNFNVYDYNDLVVLPSSSDSQSIVNEFLNKGYTQNNGELIGSKGILLKNPNGIIKTNLSIRNNNNKVYIPNNVTLKGKSDLSNFEGIIIPPTDITVNNLDDVIKAIRVGSENESLKLDGGVATITIQAPGKNSGDPVSIYYSENNGSTWDFHADDIVELIGGQPNVVFTTDHFTDFAVTLPPNQGGGSFSGSFVINSGAVSTTSQNVTLNISTTPAANQMRFSNDGSNRSSWIAYNTSYNRNLSASAGNKIVYAEFDSDGDNVADAQTNDTIEYVINDGGNGCIGGPGIACVDLEITGTGGYCIVGTNIDLGTGQYSTSEFNFNGDFLTASGTNDWICFDTLGSIPAWNLSVVSSVLTGMINGGATIPATNVYMHVNGGSAQSNQSLSFVFGTGDLESEATIATTKKVFEKTSGIGSVGTLTASDVKLRVHIDAAQDIDQYRGIITIGVPTLQ